MMLIKAAGINLPVRSDIVRVNKYAAVRLNVQPGIYDTAQYGIIVGSMVIPASRRYNRKQLLEQLCLKREEFVKYRPYLLHYFRGNQWPRWIVAKSPALKYASVFFSIAYSLGLAQHFYVAEVDAVPRPIVKWCVWDLQTRQFVPIETIPMADSVVLTPVNKYTGEFLGPIWNKKIAVVLEFPGMDWIKFVSSLRDYQLEQMMVGKLYNPVKS